MMFIDEETPSNAQGSQWGFQQQSRLDQIVQTSPKKRFSRFNQEFGFSRFKSTSRAYDAETGREVLWNAVPFRRVAPAERKKILKEISTLKTINHGHMIRCIDSWLDRSTQQVVFITELLNGGTLRNHLKKIKSPKLKIIKGWTQQLLSAIAYFRNLDPTTSLLIASHNIYLNANTNEVKLGEPGQYLCGLRNINTLDNFHIEGCYFNLEDNSECGDVLKFGLLLLEMATCKIPYSECVTLSDYYHKILNSEKPTSLELISNTELRDIIWACIGPKKSRPTLESLCNNPFWKSNQQHDNTISLISQEKIVSDKKAFQEDEVKTSTTFDNQPEQKKLKTKRNLEIQIEEQDKIIKISNNVQRRQKQKQTIFTFTLETKKSFMLSLDKANHPKEALQEFYTFLSSKLEEKTEKAVQNNREDQTTRSEIENHNKKYSFCQSRNIKEDEVIGSSHKKEGSQQFINQLFNDLSHKIRQAFSHVYETYNKMIVETMLSQQFSHFALQELMDCRMQAEKLQLQHQHHLQKQKQPKKIPKKSSRICPPSPSSVNLLDILNLEGNAYLSIIDNSQVDKYEAFKNIIRNDQMLTFNYSSINLREQREEPTNFYQWSELNRNEQDPLSIECTKPEKIFDLKYSSNENILEMLKIKSNEFFSIRESKEEESNLEKIQSMHPRIELNVKKAKAES